ncbi:hypothetical protein D3C72_1740920 [compost metagenome]
MAKGRPMAALARSLIMGLARFQSKVAITPPSTSTTRARPPTIPIAIFLVRVMVLSLALWPAYGRRPSVSCKGIAAYGKG